MARPRSVSPEEVEAALRSHLADQYTPPEPAPYYGWCGACKGWYVRGAPTRWHFTGDRQAIREHVSCGPPVERAMSPPAGRRHRSRDSRQPAPALEPGV